MVASVIRTVGVAALCVAVGLAVGCGRRSSQGPASPSPPGGALEVVTAIPGESPGITIAGVVPQAGGKVWSGSTVIVGYSRGEGDVVVEKCRLAVDGIRRPARVAWVALAPAAFIIVFTWSEPYPSGTHTFGVSLPLTSGTRATCTWTATRL